MTSPKVQAQLNKDSLSSSEASTERSRALQLIEELKAIVLKAQLTRPLELNAFEAAEYCGLNYNSFRFKLTMGEGPRRIKRFNKQNWFLVSDLDQWMTANQQVFEAGSRMANEETKDEPKPPKNLARQPKATGTRSRSDS